MGNTLTTSNSNRNINDSILGKRIKEILANQEIVVDKDNTGKIIKRKINKIRGCCMNIVKPQVGINDFITVGLPEPATDTDACKTQGRCLDTFNLGLQIKGDTDKICSNLIPNPPNADGSKSTFNNLIGGDQGLCDAFMVNKCGKELYDAGCLVIKKNKKGRLVRVWNAKNKNCFTKDGALIYGSEDCKCINSATGFTLNSDPSTTIKGGINFARDSDSPFPIKTGTSTNSYTKYSLDIFGYSPVHQRPQLFDARCSAATATAASGGSNAYKLPRYKNKNLTICLNQINIKDSDIGTANLKDIKQNNNCGTGANTPQKVEKNPKERAVELEKERLVTKRESERIEKEAALALEKQNKDEAAAKKAQVAKAKKDIEHNKEVKDLKDKAKDDKIANIKKTIGKSNETKLKTDKLKEENIKKQQELDEAKAAATKAAAAKTAAKVAESKKMKIYYGIGIFIIIAIILFFLLRGGKGKRRSRDNDDL